MVKAPFQVKTCHRSTGEVWSLFVYRLSWAGICDRKRNNPKPSKLWRYLADDVIIRYQV